MLYAFSRSVLCGLGSSKLSFTRNLFYLSRGSGSIGLAVRFVYSSEKCQFTPLVRFFFYLIRPEFLSSYVFVNFRFSLMYLVLLFLFYNCALINSRFFLFKKVLMGANSTCFSSG